MSEGPSSLPLPPAGLCLIRPPCSRGRGAATVGQGTRPAAQWAGRPTAASAPWSRSANGEEPGAAPAQWCWPGGKPALHAGLAELARAGQR